MLRLIIMRHAKAVKDRDLRDHARPLNERGVLQAEAMGHKLKHMDWLPEIILASDSMRTRETYEGFLVGCGQSIPLVLCPHFYESPDYETIRDELFPVNGVQTILVLGHNPGWSEAVEILTQEACGLHTGEAALLTHSGASWSDAVVHQGSWRLIEIVSPGIN